MSENPFVAFLQRYANDPVAFVRECLGVEPDPWQIKVLVAYNRGDRSISIRSAHGVGKSAVVSWISIHHMLCKFPQKTVATAPSAPQAFDVYFAEVKHWIKKLPEHLQTLFIQKTDRIELRAAPHSSFLTVRTSRADQPEALAGVHSDNVLLIADEASGIPEKVFESAAGSMSSADACTILIGNPVRSTGLFFDTHTRLAHRWTTVHVSAFDSPRVTPDFIDEMRERYGETSNPYRVRVLGEFPVSDDDTIIPYELIDSARHRDIRVSPHAPRVWGLDVARFGSDRSALVERQESTAKTLQIYKQIDLMELVGRVHRRYKDLAHDRRPSHIFVDSIGLGAGVVDRLRELQLPVYGVNVSESAALKDRFLNLRSELWFEARDWLNTKSVKLADDEVLCGELTVPKYKFNSGGKVQVEPKHEIKKRGLPSPDVADAFVLTFAHGGAIMAYGHSMSSTEPIRRNIKGVA